MTDTTSLMRLSTKLTLLPGPENKSAKRLHDLAKEMFTNLPNAFVEHADVCPEDKFVIDDTGLVPPDLREPGPIGRLFGGLT